MRCEVIPSEDTTTLYLRWEITPEGKEGALLLELGGPLVLVIPATNYVDVGGKFHETADVEVAIYPHPGRVNRAQAKFTDYESRRAFLEALVDGVTGDVANFIFDAEPGSVGVEGHHIRFQRSA